MQRSLLRVPALAIAAVALCATPAVAAGQHRGHAHKAPLDRVKHIVVLYEENHSFDNLYGGWEGVDGLGAADAAHTTQVDQAGAAYACLLQNDVNLTSPPLPATCTDKTFASAFPNRPFTIDTLIAPGDTTCPPPGVSAPNGVPKGAGEPGGCTRDLVHRFYDEFGGQWDHVSPPGQGAGTPGPHDAMGPGTRIPALILAPGLRAGFAVDHASHDTTSILATIEHRFRLAPVSSRDARVQDLSTAFRATPVR